MKRKKKKAVFSAFLALLLCSAISFSFFALSNNQSDTVSRKISSKKDTIKWVEFNVPYEALEKAMNIDIETYNSKLHINWIDTLAYLASIYGGDFSNYRPEDMDKFITLLSDGNSIKSITKDLKYFNYYSEAYNAVLSGMLGEYQVRTQDSNNNYSWKRTYGLKAFSPIAEGFYYSDFDDFGTNRSYGYSRRHLGHDMMVPVGTPVIATESGTIEALGWNQYGGWRIGIRSHDKKRYYYYAHLRKDSPYTDNLHIGSEVTAGDIIGYSGQTGYSLKENTNNIDTPHLHYGLQLVFDEDAKDSPTQIWIDIYNITKLLSKHRCTVVRKENGNYERKYLFAEENHYLKETQASSSAEQDEIKLPIIMYHSILRENKSNNKYIVSPDTFENDLKYIYGKGYTPVFMRDVINFVNSKGTLPEKPIVLTFDDGYYNNHYYISPLLKKYNAKAVISIIGKESDLFSNDPDENLNYSHVTWDHILQMHLSGNWEIQNHSYNCHSYEIRNGISQKPSETFKEYKQFLSADLMESQNKIAYVTGVAPNTLTYPFGAFSKNTDKIIKSLGFKASLSCTEGVSTIKRGDTECLYMLKRQLRPPDVSSETFFEFLK